MEYLIYIALLLAIVVTLVYKSRQTPMTKEEQEYELEVGGKRSKSFLMNTTNITTYSKETTK